jgi:archaellum biogenesis protein FlaJ (TadC family)
MEGRIKNYEAQISNLKKWRNCLYAIIAVLVFANVASLMYNTRYTDGEVVRAAQQVGFMGDFDILVMFEQRPSKDVLRADLYIEMARADKDVMARVKENRKKNRQ